jgi:glycosyltransferase involved in cell wall biosynthesis
MPSVGPTTPAGTPWPRILVVTPSLNQGQYLEETIRSILLQGYPNLAFVIVDGGSADSSLDVIHRYEPFIDAWVSEPDSGQADAVVKGLRMASGEMANWVNSDDLLAPGALLTIARLMGERVDAVAGACLNFGSERADEVLGNRKLAPRALVRGTRGAVFQQPAFWFRPELLEACGSLDTRLHYFFDMEMAIRYLSLFPRVAYTTDVLAHFRLHPSSKSVASGDRFLTEYQRALGSLAANPRFGSLHADCRRRLDELDLHGRLALAMQDLASSRWVRSFHVIRATLRRPRPGTLRIGAAALRRVLRGERWFLDPAALSSSDTRPAAGRGRE